MQKRLVTLGRKLKREEQEAEEEEEDGSDEEEEMEEEEPQEETRATSLAALSAKKNAHDVVESELSSLSDSYDDEPESEEKKPTVPSFSRRSSSRQIVKPSSSMPSAASGVAMKRFRRTQPDEAEEAFDLLAAASASRFPSKSASQKEIRALKQVSVSSEFMFLPFSLAYHLHAGWTRLSSSSLRSFLFPLRPSHPSLGLRRNRRPSASARGQLERFQIVVSTIWSGVEEVQLEDCRDGGQRREMVG